MYNSIGGDIFVYMMKRLLLTILSVLLTVASAHSQERRSVAGFLNDKNAETVPCTVTGVLVSISDMQTDNLCLLIKDESGEMNVRLEQVENPFKELGALDVRPGDSITISGVLASFKVQKEEERPGMSAAKILAKVDGPEHEDVCPYSFSVDTRPLFEGEDINAFSRWFNAHLDFSEEWYGELCFQGRIIMSFDIDKDGQLNNIKVEKSSGEPKLDGEVVRVLSTSPKWTPATIKGKNVKYHWQFPVHIGLR